MDYELRVEIKPDPTLELEELPEMEVVHKTTHGEMRSSIPIHAAELYEEGKNKSSRIDSGLYLKSTLPLDSCVTAILFSLSLAFCM